MKTNILLLGAISMSLTSFSQNLSPQWKVEQNFNIEPEKRKINPNQALITTIDNDQLQNFLFQLKSNRADAAIFTILNPQGQPESFYVWESSIMEEGLQNKYDHIRTYSGIKVDEPYVTAKFDFTEYGFHGIVFGSGNTYYIDPLYAFTKMNTYQVYFKNDFNPLNKTVHPCLVDDTEKELSDRMSELIPEEETTRYLERRHGSVRKQYRLALSCTGEYAQAVTGSSFPTKAAVLSAMVTTMNRVNGIYEKEISARMVLISNNDNVIYTQPGTDPFTANNNGYLLLSQNQSNLTSVIGLSNFDIGHIFSTGGGGIASLASICVNSEKGRGVTGSEEPYGDPYDVDYVAHEMGHQFGANHTFNNCDGNENNSTAYEPGSGSTIMAYAGICGFANNLQNNSHDYFHNASLNEISRYISGVSYGGLGTCGTSTTGSANITIPSYAGTYKIPLGTAFEVTAPTATWPVSSNILYMWEQHDLGQVGRNETLGATATTAPVYRSYKPSVAGKYRSFPHADSVHRNTYTFKGERMPTVGRTIRTKVTARGIDSEGFGSFDISDDIITVQIISGTDPFVVTSPNTGSESYPTGSSVTVTWNPGGSTAPSINCTQVDIFLSIDGGKTYPYMLATGVPNSGSASVVIPTGTTTTLARIKVKGHNNVFYDVSNKNFIITTGTTSVEANYQLAFNVYPNPANNVLNIDFDQLHQISSITITNVLGQEVITMEENLSQQIDISQLTPGQYTIKLINATTQEVGIKTFIKL